jgi:hypothetical protein
MYSVIRFVPDPARGEFINVGAIAGSEESKEWQIRQVENPARARHMDSNGSFAAVWDFIDRIGRNIDEYQKYVEEPLPIAPPAELSEKWLTVLYGHYRNVVQLSEPTLVIADGVDEALDKVFGELIIDPGKKEWRALTKTAAMARLRNVYKRVGLSGEELWEKIDLEVGAFHQICDFAIVRPKHRAIQIAQAWSFQVDLDVVLQQVKAWGWGVSKVRESGGKLWGSSGQAVDADTKISVAVLYVPPKGGKARSQLNEAIQVWRDIHAEVAEIERAEEIGRIAEVLWGEAVSSNR